MARTKPTIALSPLLDIYLTSCRIEGKSSETVRSYKETLGVFVKVVADEGLPADPGLFTTAHVYQFLGSVADTGVTAMTQWRRQRETRAFFSWLLRHDYISSNQGGRRSVGQVGTLAHGGDAVTGAGVGLERRMA